MNPSRIGIFFLAALACAGLSNWTASRERKLVWVGSYSAQSRPLETVPPSQSASEPSPPGAQSLAPKDFPPHPDRAWADIASEDAQRLFRAKALFLDARRTAAYTQGHISGARSFPVWESDIADRVKALYEEGLDQNAPIVAYCSGGDCEDSRMLAEKLYMVGFNNVLVYKDGFPDWQKQELPITKGPQP